MQCDILILGEFPQEGEYKGRIGRALKSALKDANIDPDDCYWSDLIGVPTTDKKVGKKEIAALTEKVKAEIEDIKPKFVLGLGNVALQCVTGTTGIKKKRGKPVELEGMVFVPTLSPGSFHYDPTNEYQFKRDLGKFSEIVEFGGIPFERAVDYVVVDTWPKVEEMLQAMRGSVSSDCETTGLYPWEEGAQIVTIGFGTREKQWILPCYSEVKGWPSPWTRKDRMLIMERVAERLENCYVIGHNWKFDRLWMRVHYGVDIRCDFDTMLAHYAINENMRHGLDELAQFYFGAPEWDVPLKLKQGKEGKWKDHALYLAQDLYYTRKLRFRLQKELDKDWEVARVFERILVPCSDLFTEVEFNGVYVNSSKFGDAEKYLRGEMEKAEAELKKYGDINWGSPKQVADLLFKKLKIKCPQKTPKGGYSTSESTLKQIDHPCVGALLKFRGAKQQLSFFIEGWKPYLVNNRLHPSFKLHGTVTGRLSCENPNLQQVPRDPRIRSLITAPEGWTLIEADLSQIELRITAELSGDRELSRVFHEGRDAHWLTALTEIARGGGKVKEVLETAKVLTQGKSVKYNEAIQILLEAGPDACADILKDWKELRKKAKAVNFGYVFGMWWKKFKIYARDNYDVHLTDKEAEESRKSFFALYCDIEDWHKRQKNFAHEHGYVRSLSGRKRRLPDAMLYDDTPARAEALRQSINSPVQSFANDLNLMAALQLRSEFPRNIVRIVGTVHDAILLEVKNEYIEQVYTRLLQIMSRPDMMNEFEIDFSIPIEAEAKIGPWSEGVSLEKWKAANSNIPQKKYVRSA